MCEPLQQKVGNKIVTAHAKYEGRKNSRGEALRIIFRIQSPYKRRKTGAAYERGGKGKQIAQPNKKLQKEVGQAKEMGKEKIAKGFNSRGGQREGSI